MTEIEHADILKAALGGTPQLVLLTAPAWCLPCRRFKPHWDAAKAYLNTVEFTEIDMGENPEDTQDHWAYDWYAVRSVPTVLLFWKSSLGMSETRIEARTIISFVKEVEDHLEQR